MVVLLGVERRLLAKSGPPRPQGVRRGHSAQAPRLHRRGSGLKGSAVVAGGGSQRHSCQSCRGAQVCPRESSLLSFLHLLTCLCFAPPPGHLWELGRSLDLSGLAESGSKRGLTIVKWKCWIPLGFMQRGASEAWGHWNDGINLSSKSCSPTLGGSRRHTFYHDLGEYICEACHGILKHS